MLNIAVIGAGRIGTVHAAAVAAHPGTRLTWIADPFGDGAARLAAEHGAKSTLAVDEALHAEDVDAVIIGSPTPLHVDHILAAAAAGKKIMCEKPVDLDIARVDACIAQLGDRADRVMIGFNRRFDPGFAEIQARAAAGEIGDLEQVTIISRDPAAPPASYVAQSGGIFRDMTIHDFDMARFLLGDIVEVNAVGQHLDPQIEAAGDFDAAVVTLTAASGAVATIINNRHCPSGYDQRLEVCGSTGMLEAANHRATLVRYSGAEYTEAAAPYLNFFLERYTAAYTTELSAFVTAVEHDTPITPNVHDGRAALAIADAATHSARTGERVRLS
ncbi:myo-inositol 2-dehydrogenase [Austwickia chelonae]|uniref:Putative inositol 2-dehydrogenase n=1 Tax=Austwickia chelonae NBRC 105200 TaxID=1184607 RepID=K6UMC6_9MICO|nr:inositol 2-dehydrogenase [Austwickia chelonae]GAB77996.1 putative inositol 2-dehydrogenase [Austwickia chelonae NBRC 105200]SEV93935.1 myo-inositol 2-dehydrogenase [Austwickia chelonae]